MGMCGERKMERDMHGGRDEESEEDNGGQRDREGDRDRWTSRPRVRDFCLSLFFC